jgi:hypothetical protein
MPLVVCVSVRADGATRRKRILIPYRGCIVVPAAIAMR